MTRSQIRECLFKLLFRIEFNSPEEMPEQINMFFDDTVEDEDNKPKGGDVPDFDAAYIRDKYEKIISVLPEVDAKIDNAANGWSVDRIAKVDIAILRLAVYEMLYDEDIPVSVAIDEAVELAKKFGQDNSSSFINGILATLAK